MTATAFKYEAPGELPPHQQAVLDGDYSRAFPDNESADAGLLVLNNQHVVEVRNSSWTPQTTPSHERAAELLVSAASGGFSYESEDPWDPTRPTLGSETELAVMDTESGRWHAIFPDGRDLHLPDGGRVQKGAHPFTPEALQTMVEHGTPKATGYSAFAKEVITQAYEIEQFLEKSGVVAPALSVYPETYADDDLSRLPYVRTTVAKMPHILEFGCMGNQLHVQMPDVAAGLHALYEYQAVQAVFGLITASAPARDGSFETTLSDHYFNNGNPEYKNPVAEADIINRYGGKAPYDWREFSRLFGSPSAGTFQVEPLFNLNDVMTNAEQSLVSGDNVSAGRVLGWHTDRLRLDLGTLEICNLGRAGGNLYKTLAVYETVAKFLVAVQEYHAKGGGESFSGGLEGYTPVDARKALCEIGHLNNVYMALSGKETKLLRPDGHVVTPRELLDTVIAFTNRYSPVPVNSTAQNELYATLAQPPTVEQYTGRSVQDVFHDFYSPNSPMTGTEAQRLAHHLAPDMPLNELLRQFALAQRAHVYSVYEEQQTGAANV